MQYTLYIRKDINERFKDEEEKSKLVNTLLDTHYSINVSAKQKPEAKKEPEKPLMVENWGNLDKFAAERGLDKATKHPSIPEQLEALGLTYDKTTPNQAFDPDGDRYIPYKVIDGEVII